MVDGANHLKFNSANSGADSVITVIDLSDNVSRETL